MDRDAEHLRLLSIFHYVVGGLAAFFGCFFLIYIVAGIVMLNVPQNFGARNGPPPAFMGWFFVAMGCAATTIAWLISGFLVSGGYFLSRRKHHTFCLVAAGVSCLWIPFGTILGVFSIIVLQRTRVREMFGKPVSAS